MLLPTNSNGVVNYPMTMICDGSTRKNLNDIFFTITIKRTKEVVHLKNRVTCQILTISSRILIAFIQYQLTAILGKDLKVIFIEIA